MNFSQRHCLTGLVSQLNQVFLGNTFISDTSARFLSYMYLNIKAETHSKTNSCKHFVYTKARGKEKKYQ